MSSSQSIYNLNLSNISLRIILLLLLSLNCTELRSQTVPSNRDFLLASTVLGIAAGVELFAKDHYLPTEPRFSTPNQIDVSMRNTLYLGASKQELAKTWSDRLVYGVSLSSLVWGPLLSEDHKQAVLINMEVFAVNSLITNLVKIGVARERPYHYYGSRPSLGPTDNASFFSGHSSVAFSQAVTNAMLLSEYYPERKGLIWSSLLGTAGVTAYLRVAGDMHYFSDVVIGAGAGSLIAWAITRFELKRFNNPDSDQYFNFSVGLPKKNAESGMNYQFVFKIPLG